MQTEQPTTTNGSLAPTRRLKSQAKQRKLIHSLRQAADERRAQGRYAEAEPLYLCALALAEEICAVAEAAVVHNNLTALYKRMGRFDDAGRLYRRALALMEESLGPEHPEAAADEAFFIR
ncbi:MAG: tetratricopeptide repeat protein [Blastocatellia bacterium]